jgi:antiviral helicase SKI2
MVDFGELEILTRVESTEDITHAFRDELDVTNFSELVPERAMVHPFALDDFQKRAVVRLEERQNVMVVAHTSAGKTAVAEYAIAMSRNCGTKVVYTSPLKALSN